MSYQPPGGPPPPPGGPPPQGYPDPQQPWSQQLPWPHQQFDPSLPPKKRGSGWKWALGAVAVLVVIGVTAAVTIYVTKDGGDGDSGPTPSGETFGLASADDKGPVNIITEDPTCAAWTPINNTFVDIQKKGWDKRDPSVPASDWTPEQRKLYEEVGKAARRAADQTVPLAKQTPHRVMRELYEQFVAYARAYSDAIPNYTPNDDHLAGVAISSSAALLFGCGSITYGAAQARAPLVSAPNPPSDFAELTNPDSPQRFMPNADPSCPEWDRLLTQFDNDTPEISAWQALDANVSASNWTAEQQAIVDAVIPVMTEFADHIEQLGRTSANPTVQDFAVLAAQYRRAYVKALPTYGPADSYLARTSARATSTINSACKGAGG